MKSLASMVLCMVLLPVPPAVVAARDYRHVDAWPDKYDRHFRKYSKRYFGPSFDWRWFKAQGVAESNLQPAVKSTAGAIGVMQILPSTFEEIRKRNTHFANIREPRWNIAAGIFYDRSIYRKLSARVPATERMYMTLASYNAGYGTLLNAQKKARKKGRPEHRWESLKPYTPRETQGYVKRISRLMGF